MAKRLKVEANNVAVLFSNKERKGNVAKETFTVETITVLSECTAAVTYYKTPTKKKTLAWFYFIAARDNPRWEYFFVTYSHLVGLHRVSKLLHDVEQHNFDQSISS